jgi:hypothetical protein
VVAEVDEIDLTWTVLFLAALSSMNWSPTPFKHAFPDGREGSIQVQLKLLEGTVVLWPYLITALAFLRPRPHKFNGMQLVHDLALQLRGVARCELWSRNVVHNCI